MQRVRSSLLILLFMPASTVLLSGCNSSSGIGGESTTLQGVQRTQLNDTGVIHCADDANSDLSCGPTTPEHPGQDAEIGRDRLYADDTDGLSGFVFTKIDAAGNPLPADSLSWECVFDRTTRLTWETKTGGTGIRSAQWTYTWYDLQIGKGTAGSSGAGICNNATECDTASYVSYVNNTGLCGFRDWRLPTVAELRSIQHFETGNPTIDSGYFPYTRSAAYHSASIAVTPADSAWTVDFGNGPATVSPMGSALYLRLVR